MFQMGNYGPLAYTPSLNRRRPMNNQVQATALPMQANVAQSVQATPLGVSPQGFQQLTPQRINAGGMPGPYGGPPVGIAPPLPQANVSPIQPMVMPNILDRILGRQALGKLRSRRGRILGL